jgi:hypothetical protein
LILQRKLETPPTTPIWLAAMEASNAHCKAEELEELTTIPHGGFTAARRTTLNVPESLGSRANRQLAPPVPVASALVWSRIELIPRACFINRFGLKLETFA